MKSFNSLISLIKSLSSEELKSLQKFLKYYNNKNGLNKSVELVEIIVNEKDLNVNSIQKKIYSKINNFAFNKLVDRLNDKILEVLIFDSNISKKYYPERVKVIFDLKKKLIQSDILSLKGLREDSDKLCKKVIIKAEKYELYDIVMNALAIRQRFINIRKSQFELKRIQDKLESFEIKNKAVIHSQIIYNGMMNRISNSADSNSYYKELIIVITELQEYFNIHKSSTIGYYLYFLNTEKLQIEKNYSEAAKCLEIIKELVTQKSLYSANRMGTTLINIANNNIHLESFEEAISNAENAKMYFPNNIFNRALVDEYLFYSYFYLGRFKKAETLIEQLIRLPKENITTFSINKWNYFSAVLSFIKKDYNGCIDKLKLVIEIDKDKEGWNINKRLLIIMSRIELMEFESVDLQVINLEKFIKRSLQKRDVRIRYIYIIRILIKLINSNYDFSFVEQSRKNYLSKISSKDDFGSCWKIKSPELIIFDQWFKSKLV